MRKHKEGGCHVLSYQLKNEEKTSISPASIWCHCYPKKPKKEPLKFYEMKKPFSMVHGDVMAGKRLPSGKRVYQCTIEDDYSRGYVGKKIATYKDPRIVVYAFIDMLLKWKTIPTCFHYDNGSECKCKIFTKFIENLSRKYNQKISIIHTKVRKPKGNGKKERAHRDDRRDFWRKTRSNKLKTIDKNFDGYVYWLNNKRGRMPLKGKPPITRLKENKKTRRRFKKEILEGLVAIKVDERIVRPLGIIRLHNTIYHTDPALEGQKVDLWETLKGLEVRKDRVVITIIKEYWKIKAQKSKRCKVMSER